MWRTLILTSCLAGPAWAVTDITPKASNDTMATASYKPDRIYPVKIAQGQSFIISVGDKVTIADSYGQDDVTLAAQRDQLGHTISLHTEKTDISPPRLFTILGRHAPDGATYRYQLQVSVAKDGDALTSLTFTYPDEIHAAQVAAWKAAAAAREEKADAAELQRQQQAEHCTGQVNNHYVLQGATQTDWDLLPTREVCDDGEKTYFHFPGNMSIPLIYSTNDKGEEILADYTFNSISRVATVHAVYRAFHLHNGLDHTSLLCIFNHDYNAVGTRSTSGTVSPDIKQIVK